MPDYRLADLISVAKVDSGTFVGSCLPGARGRIFGGQVAAQALRAATLVVAHGRWPHSLHSCFLRPGDPSLPVVYIVTTLKEGRSLSTFRVDARQEDKTIFTALASFHLDEPSASYQTSPPDAPGPLECPESDYVPPGTNAAVRRPVEFRFTDTTSTDEAAAPPLQLTWLRARGRLPDDLSLHACALAYVADLTLTRTAHMPLRAPGTTRLGSSLDHSVWFHRPFRADEWLLFAQETASYASARALTNGRLFTIGGTIVGSVSQEALIRVTT